MISVGQKNNMMRPFSGTNKVVPTNNSNDESNINLIEQAVDKDEMIQTFKK